MDSVYRCLRTPPGRVGTLTARVPTRRVRTASVVHLRHDDRAAVRGRPLRGDVAIPVGEVLEPVPGVAGAGPLGQVRVRAPGQGGSDVDRLDAPKTPGIKWPRGVPELLERKGCDDAEARIHHAQGPGRPSSCADAACEAVVRVAA